MSRGSRLKGAGQGIDRDRVYPSPADITAQIGNSRPGWASANPRNLMGFLDAFKAIPRFSTNSPGGKAPSLTACEDFA